jgi:bifunctional polynucleotide phosphatase/kinase
VICVEYTVVLQTMAYYTFHSTQPQMVGPLRLAFFDLDGTLITSKTGKRWSIDGDDWVFQGSVPSTLQKYADEGWTLVIITNQSEWNKNTGPRTKCEAVLGELFRVNGWSPWCLVATGKPSETVYRKPGRGLYDELLNELDMPHVSEVFMCGDAVGVTATRAEYRWSDADSGFAKAIGARFETPDTIFGTNSARLNTEVKELVILVGNMGSGKSSSAYALVAQSKSIDIVCAYEYTHLEQDVLKTPKAMLRASRTALAHGSVVVDATHATSASRAPYIALARELGIQCRILWHIRNGRPYNALRDSPVPDIAYSVYSKRFEDPRLDGIYVEMIY